MYPPIDQLTNSASLKVCLLVLNILQVKVEFHS